ncbi:MAG TPA: 6-phosphogluconolactonase [Terriglobales bacterium]|nr:6-phosphogluconolactonase [Terriglobales bacterium]
MTKFPSSSCIRIVRTLPTPADLFRGAADEFVRLGRELIAKRGRFVVALSGGSTPRTLYSLLAKDYADFSWSRTFLFFGDERHVPPDHPDSNYRMVNEALLSKISIPTGNVFRVQAEIPDATAVAANYEAAVRQFFRLQAGEFPVFDLVLLGLGGDGHTASIFPDSDGLKEQSRLVIANWVEKFKTHRISFTYPVLNHASDAMFLVAGAGKSEILQAVLEGNFAPPYPAQLVQPESRLIWMLDEAAASKLSQ